MKKLLCFITALAFLALSACGGNTTQPITNTESSVAESDHPSAPSADSSAEESSADEISDVSREDSVSSEDSSEGDNLLVSGDYKYSLVNTVAMIAAYTGTDEELELPTELDGYTVTAITSGAFANNTKLKRLTVGDTVVNIENGAFSGCTALEYISIGSSVAVLEASVFEDCTALKEFDVSSGNTSFSAVDGLLYNGDCTVLFRCPQSAEKEQLDLPTTLTLIAEDAFSACTGIKSVKLPTGCQLAKRAFFHCMNLEAVELGEGLTAIPEKAFFGCVMLKEITVPEGVTEIGDYAYFGCVSASSATLPASITAIGSNVFKSCSALKKISVSGDYGKAWYNETGKSYINS